MDIYFDSNKPRKLLSDDAKLKKKCGPQQAGRIRARLDDLCAADNLGQFRYLPGRCHELKGKRHGQLSLGLVHPDRLIFLPARDQIPVKPDGGLDWDRVQTVVILGIEDAHE